MTIINGSVKKHIIYVKTIMVGILVHVLVGVIKILRQMNI